MNKQTKLRIGVITVLFLTTLVTSALTAKAQSNGGPPGGDHPQWRAIRHVRMAACADKSVGTTCSFSQGGQWLTGTCQPVQQGKLACRNVVGRQGAPDDPFESGMSVGDLPEQ